MHRQGEEEEAPLHGDLLEIIFSHVSLLDLVPASYVSNAWRRAVHSSLSTPTRAKPWLLLNLQNPRTPSAITRLAYDPNIHEWIRIPHVPTSHVSPLLSSHSSFLYTLSPSKFAFISDPLGATWCSAEGPHVWRSDPVVTAVSGSHIVVAGGTCDFEDDPLSVEMYDIEAWKWDTCQPMPDIFKGSASATWLSVAVTCRKMHVLEKNSGAFCVFDVETKRWGRPSDLRPDPSMFFCTVGSWGDRLILIGLGGDPTNVESLGIWEVDYETCDCKEIGKTPVEMIRRLVDVDSYCSSIGISMAGDFVYVYKPSDPKEIIFFCEFAGGVCEWGSVPDLVVDDRNRMDRVLFTCSKMGINDLRTLYRWMKRKYQANSDGN